MTVKEYLSSIKLLDIRLNNKICEKEELYTMATRITPVYSSEPKSSNFNVSDKVGNLTAKIVDMDKEISDMIIKLFELKQGIIAKIEMLRDPRYYSVLYKRYVQYKDFSVIAAEMHYTYQTTINLHNEALKAFEKVMKY